MKQATSRFPLPANLGLTEMTTSGQRTGYMKSTISGETEDPGRDVFQPSEVRVLIHGNKWHSSVNHHMEADLSFFNLWFHVWDG